MPRRNKALKIGDTAPPFTLRSVQHADVDLESYIGEKHLILVFFRGTW